jgi:transcriptional regulator with XRE-family HTH domain
MRACITVGVCYVANMVTGSDEPPRHYLREWRERLGVTQTALAKRIGCPVSQISRYETGDTRLHVEMLFRLAAGLGVSATALLAHPDEGVMEIRAPGASDDTRRQIANVVKALTGK